MDKRSGLIQKVLLNRYHPEDQQAFLQLSPPQEKKIIESLQMRSTEIAPLLHQSKRTLERMHYSWIKPLLNQFPEPLHPYLIASLNSEQIAGLKPKTTPLPHLTPPSKIFMQSQFFPFLELTERLPYEYLPQTELSPFGEWSKKELMTFFDFLGLYDLASEVRKIVNKTHLKNIYTCLNPKQFYFLKSCLHQKEKIVTPPIGIDPAKPDCSKLKQLIHRRGLIRFGKTLCGQHPDFAWYIAHVLDTGRGTILLSQYRPDTIPSITPVLQSQALNVMNFLTSE